MNYNKTLGEYLEEERIRQGLTKRQLCAGLCDSSTYGRYEADIIIPDRFMLGTILERLGKNSEHIGYICASDEIVFRRYRNDIQAVFEEDKEDSLETIRDILENYENDVTVRSKKIHMQYIGYVRGKLAEMEGDEEAARVSYKKALDYTKIDYEDIDGKLLLSVQEFEIIFSLFRLDKDIDKLMKLESLVNRKSDYDIIKIHFYGELVQTIIGNEGIFESKKRNYAQKALEYKKRIYQIKGTKDLLYSMHNEADFLKSEEIIKEINEIVSGKLWQII